MAKEIKVNTGVMVLVVNEQGQFLMGRREGSHGAGTWSVPGGWMRRGETPEATADREVREEVGVTIRYPRVVAYTNDIFPDDNQHSFTIWVVARWWSGVPYISEPDKFMDVHWVYLHNMPQPLFLPFRNVSLKLLYNGIDAITQLSKK